MRYLPITEKERAEMLEKIGVDSVDDLFSPVPESVRVKGHLNLPEAKSEMEIQRHMKSVEAGNTGAEMLSFLGGGCYKHYAPSLIDQLISRSEFFTAYTPYQPEVSQGTLRAIFEFQTMIANLYGMDVSNASMYDGASAAAEALLMALRASKKKRKVVVASTVHPHYLATVRTYLKSFADSIEVMDMDPETGRIRESELEKIDGETSAVLFQYPNYFGVIEDIHAIAKKAKDEKAMVIPVVAEATSLGVLATPGDIDADIAVGEGQALGIPLSFGGPGVGLFTVKSKLARKMPGRLVGKSVDRDGAECYVLTLAAREQHIKREKATSNICSNQGLMALAAGMYLATMGKEGLKKVSLMNIKRKEYLLNKIEKETSMKRAFSGPTYNEFSLVVPGKADDLCRKMAEKGILAGIPASKYFPELENVLIVNTTEMHTYEEIDRFVDNLKETTGGDR